MVWIGCVHCKKLSCDFVARTSSIAPVQPVLHRVSCSNQTNPKCAKTIRNEPILEFRVQWGGSDAFVAKNSNATSWHKLVPCSNETLPNAPKHYETLQNMSLAPMGWIECVLCEKFRCDFMAQTCTLIAPVQPVLHRVDKCIQTLRKRTKT